MAAVDLNVGVREAKVARSDRRVWEIGMVNPAGKWLCRLGTLDGQDEVDIFRTLVPDAVLVLVPEEPEEPARPATGGLGDLVE